MASKALASGLKQSKQSLLQERMAEKRRKGSTITILKLTHYEDDDGIESDLID